MASCIHIDVETTPKFPEMLPVVLCTCIVFRNELILFSISGDTVCFVCYQKGLILWKSWALGHTRILSVKSEVINRSCSSGLFFLTVAPSFLIFQEHLSFSNESLCNTWLNAQFCRPQRKIVSIFSYNVN